MRRWILFGLLLPLLWSAKAEALSQSDVPTKFTIPWGNSAGVPYIRTIPTTSQIGIQNCAASLTDGFPPLTFVPSNAGGCPPFGQDFNGILKQISQWSRWQAAGGPLYYDAAFSASIGGYPKGTILGNAATAGCFWISVADNNTSDPDTGGANWSPGCPSTASPTGTTSTGSANAQVVSTTPFLPVATARISFIAGFTNTGATTLKANTLGPLSVVKMIEGVGLVPLTGGEFRVGEAITVIYDGANWQIPPTGTPIAGGRLVASSDNTSCAAQAPEQTATLTGVTRLCYVPFDPGRGNLIWINGSNYAYSSAVSIILDATNFTLGNSYDVWMTVSAGAAIGCVGSTAWPGTPSLSNRGIAQNVNGLYQNSAPITHCFNNGTDTGALGINAATYIGSVYITANGQTSWMLDPGVTQGGSGPTGLTDGGVATFLGVFNAYHQLEVTSIEMDGVISFNPATSCSTNGTPPPVKICPTFHNGVNGGLNNRISWLDGLGLSTVFVSAYIGAMSSDGTSGSGGSTFAVIDCTNCDYWEGPWTQMPPQTGWGTGASGTPNFGAYQESRLTFRGIGFHFAQMMESFPVQALIQCNSSCALIVRLRM